MKILKIKMEIWKNKNLKRKMKIWKNENSNKMKI